MVAIPTNAAAATHANSARIAPAKAGTSPGTIGSK
jgi:hypothetical protein